MLIQFIKQMKSENYIYSLKLCYEMKLLCSTNSAGLHNFNGYVDDEPDEMKYLRKHKLHINLYNFYVQHQFVKKTNSN